jgi:hypothetical protein
MGREDFAVPPEQVPEEARVYLDAMRMNEDHPFVAAHFSQVTWFSWHLAGQGKVEFYALEFRAGLHAALIWNDGEGHWGAGAWLPLAHADDEVSGSPGLSMKYFQGTKAHRSLLGAIHELEAAKPA